MTVNGLSVQTVALSGEVGIIVEVEVGTVVSVGSAVAVEGITVSVGTGVSDGRAAQAVRSSTNKRDNVRYLFNIIAYSSLCWLLRSWRWLRSVWRKFSIG